MHLDGANGVLLQIALMSTEADKHITFLEKSLLQLNQRQGLGFLVAKTVIDNGKLQRTAKTVAGLVLTIGPVMLAWSTTSNDADGSDSLRLDRAAARDDCGHTPEFWPGSGLRNECRVYTRS